MSMIENLAASVTITRLQTEELFTRHSVPPRSKLYGLVPGGLGTVWQESLTSYLNRLAWHHHVPPQHLVAQEIVPRLRRSYSRRHIATFSWTSAMSVNGNGPLAQEWADILETLTRRPDLHFLTFQWWVGDLLPHKLLRKKPAWRPACYAEWRDQALPIYEPLLWGCQPVTMCVKHHRKLESHCPCCERQQPFIRLQAALDQCTHCNAWLGTSAQALEEPVPEVIEWQKWVIHALEELCSAMASSALPSWEQFFTNLSRSCEERGEQSRLAELAGLARGQLATWLRRSHTPTLESILEFCYVCNVTPRQVLLGDLAPLKQVIAEGKPFRPPRSRRLYRPVDRERCLERIQAVLDGREEPLGYGSLAQQLGYHQSALRHHFPQECALLSKQIKEYRRQQAEQRVARIREEIRQAVLALHAQGVYPSHRKVIDLLANPKLMRHPEARAFRLTLCQELGWETSSL
jgi:transcriptional regulator with XRE-family HTH domain